MFLEVGEKKVDGGTFSALPKCIPIPPSAPHHPSCEDAILACAQLLVIHRLHSYTSTPLVQVEGKKNTSHSTNTKQSLVVKYSSSIFLEAPPAPSAVCFAEEREPNSRARVEEWSAELSIPGTLWKPRSGRRNQPSFLQPQHIVNELSQTMWLLGDTGLQTDD